MGPTGFEELVQRCPDLGYVLAVKGEAFEKVMGADWARRHPLVHFFQKADGLQSIVKQQEMDFKKLLEAMERFMAHEEAFEDRSEAVEALRSTYRDLLPRSYAGYAEKLDQRIRSSLEDPKTFVGLLLLALNLSPEDPRKDPQCWKMWFSAGFAFIQLEKLDKASRFLEQAVELNPAAIPALNELATLRLTQDRRAEGEALLKRVLELDPENMHALCNAAGACLEAGRRAEALAYLQRAQAIDPADAHLRALLQIAGRT